MKICLTFFLALSLLTFAGEKYGVYDLRGNRISTFEAEQHELLEKIQQFIGDNSQKKIYVSSLKKGKDSKPSSQYHFKSGAYIEASRNETFSICPDKKAEGTWISEYSVSLNEKNCLSVQTPDLAGTFRILFMESSGLTDTIQVLVEQSYIQMGDYSHTIFVVDTAKMKADERMGYIYASKPGNYESTNYSQPLIVDKTKFTMRDAQYYSKIGDIPENLKLEDPKLPLLLSRYNDYAWKYANERSKKEGLDTTYYRTTSGSIALDTSASGYRLPSEEEWFILMRAGASTKYFWGDELPYDTKEDYNKISRYVWLPPLGTKLNNGYTYQLRPVAQRLPNEFGLYDMIGIASESCDSSPESFIICNTVLFGYNSSDKTFRLLRKTSKQHKLDKF